ncbi:MAG: chorismate synthase [Spirochaetes bacterium]|nr:chorismate synthase [Spirochaetota bacterium]
MPGSCFGEFLTVSTFGESHGTAVGVVVDGVPPGLELSIDDIQRDLDRRRPGQSLVTSARRESDRAELLSGLFEGRTTGTPIAIVIRNEGHRSSDYERLREAFRPGHADWSYQAKYGIRDWRGGGRASGRETAARVAAGAVARAILAGRGITVTGYALEIAGIRAGRIDLAAIEANPVRCPDPEAARLMERAIAEAKDAGDSVGGVVEVLADGIPAGLGDPVFDKLEALLAHATLSVGAVRGFEIGSGFGAARMRGSVYNDELYAEDGRVRSRTNHAGGVSGGISTGERLVVRCAIRPPASIARSQRTVTGAGEPVEIAIGGRHDPCIVPRAVPVLEAMVALVLADRLLAQAAISQPLDRDVQGRPAAGTSHRPPPPAPNGR